VLALGIAAQAELIVSGDKDLLVLGQYAHVPIVIARAAIEALEARFKQP
jgi:predicted nucleic acid-binding protein